MRTKQSQSIINYAIIEIKRTLMGTKSRMTEAEDRIGEVKHRMLEIYEEERKKKKKKKTKK